MHAWALFPWEAVAPRKVKSHGLGVVVNTAQSKAGHGKFHVHGKRESAGPLPAHEPQDETEPLRAGTDADSRGIAPPFPCERGAHEGGILGCVVLLVVSSLSMRHQQTLIQVEQPLRGDGRWLLTVTMVEYLL